MFAQRLEWKASFQTVEHSVNMAMMSMNRLHVQGSCRVHTCNHVCQCRKQSPDGSPVWHNHSSHSQQYQVVRIRRLWTSWWSAQGPRWLPWSITVAQPDGKVTKQKGVDDTTSTTSAATTTVIANQFLGKLQSKGLEILEGVRLTSRLHQNVGICDCHIKEKEKIYLQTFLLLDLHW